MDRFRPFTAASETQGLDDLASKQRKERSLLPWPGEGAMLIVLADRRLRRVLRRETYELASDDAQLTRITFRHPKGAASPPMRGAIQL